MQIILACTAIQSMAIFVGVVGAVRVEWRRWLAAFLISVPVIYVLNLGRNMFVISSFGNQWFQILPDMVVRVDRRASGLYQLLLGTQCDR